MSHSHQDMLCTVMGGRTHDFIQHRYQGVIAFQTEAFLADKGFVQEGLELFHLNQPVQQLFTFTVVQGSRGASGFRLTVQPAQLLLVMHMPEFIGNSPGIGLKHALDGIPCGLDISRSVLPDQGSRQRQQILTGQIIGFIIQPLGHRVLPPVQRINVGGPMAMYANISDQLRGSYSLFQPLRIS